MHGVGRFPQSVRLKVVADGRRRFRFVEIGQPIGHVHPMHHEVREDAAAEIPEPAPIAKAIFVERLILSVAEEVFPNERLGIDVQFAELMPQLVAIPSEMDFMDVAQRAVFDDLPGLLQVRHAPLLHADLHDALVIVLRIDHGLSFGEVVRERLLNVNVFPGRAGIDGHRHVPMVGRADQYGVDIFAIENLAVLLRRDRLRIGQLLGQIDVHVPNIAYGSDAHARHFYERFHQPAAAAAGADTGDVDGFVRVVAPARRGEAGRESRG